MCLEGGNRCWSWSQRDPRGHRVCLVVESEGRDGPRSSTYGALCRGGLAAPGGCLITGHFPCRQSRAPEPQARKVPNSSQGNAEGKGLRTHLHCQVPPCSPSAALAGSRNRPLDQGRTEQGLPPARSSNTLLEIPREKTWDRSETAGHKPTFLQLVHRRSPPCRARGTCLGQRRRPQPVSGVNCPP